MTGVGPPFGLTPFFLNVAIHLPVRMSAGWWAIECAELISKVLKKSLHTECR
jgi:hypothetical protein